MKKTYVRPEVYFESFELSASIAAGCGTGFNHDNTNFSNPDSCQYFFGTEKVFLNIGPCTLTNNKDKFCYNVPTDNQAIFSS